MKPSASQVEQIVKEIKSAEDKSLFVATRAFYDNSDIFVQGALQRIWIETRYMPEDFEDWWIQSGNNEARWIENGIQLSTAKIWRITNFAISPDTLSCIGDSESGDFGAAAQFISEYVTLGSDSIDEIEGGEEMAFSNLLFYFNDFEVNKEFRCNGLGHYLAAESLRIAGAMNFPFIVYPARTEGYSEGNDPERLRKFWMTFQDDMYWNEEWKVVYSRAFEIKSPEYEW